MMEAPRPRARAGVPEAAATPDPTPSIQPSWHGVDSVTGPSIWQPVVQLLLHSTSAASRGTALRLGQIQAVFSLGAPCPPGTSLVSVQRRTCTTDCCVARNWGSPFSSWKGVALTSPVEKW